MTTHKINLFMKNIFKTMLCAIIALAAISCENSGTEKGNRLATPDVGCLINGTSVILSWEPVEYAALYEVSVDDAEAARTDECTYVVTDLMYSQKYTIKVTAIAANQQTHSNSLPCEIDVEMPARDIPQYREWYPSNGAAGTAISNNGRYVVGTFDHQAFILDLNSDELTELSDIELNDVADNGVAVGSSLSTNINGVPAIYDNGKVIELDVSGLAENLTMGALTSITPDGKYAVGWLWDGAETYYTTQYGEYFPICYDLTSQSLSVPAIPETLPYYTKLAGIAPKAIAPDRSILGYEASLDMFSIIWTNESTPYEYVYFNYDDQYNPVECIGDSNNLFSPKGRYVYGKGKLYDAEGYPTEYPAAYDRETGEMMWFSGGSVTAMTDDGIVFINDAPYYIGTTSYIVDLNTGDLSTQTPIADWLALEHGLSLGSYIPDGIIVIGTSEDGKTILGITNTMEGWLTCVIKLDGVAME